VSQGAPTLEQTRDDSELESLVQFGDQVWEAKREWPVAAVEILKAASGDPDFGVSLQETNE